MDNEQTKQLCLELLRADSGEAVIAILKKSGHWDNPDAWRLYGDKEGNFAQAGNQQSLPEAALVEKIINSVDARLMGKCLEHGIAPESEDAPESVRDAVAMFFENGRSRDDQAGTLVNWPSDKRTKESRHISLAATGERPTRGRKSRNMCLTIVDQGEGQPPQRLPQTILSLNAKNKQRIRFVQGKFNMGGSGALRFCVDGLQLVISRRKPALRESKSTEDSSGGKWGFTVVRREEPSNKSGDPIHSEFTYLAPIGAEKNPRGGEVLSFSSETLNILPEHDEPYARHAEWGTAIKLYEYETSVGQSNILMKDGLLYALERRMPEIALPVRLHECRGYEGKKEASFETTISGLVVRLEDGKGDNLEPGFPLSVPLQAAGMSMTAKIYAFKESKASTYLKNEGIIFAINGQTHGELTKAIFSRPKAVGLPRLKDSLLVLVDCSGLTATQREDLFMSSRDRLSQKPIRNTVEREIEVLLKSNPKLKELQQQRRAQDVDSKLSEEKPLEEVLNKVLKASPTLKTIFLQGQRLRSPFKRESGEGDGDSDGSKIDGQEAFKGKRHPTYFRIARHTYGKEYVRNCEEGRRCRVKFETDVENGYFDRATDSGSFDLEIVDSSVDASVPAYSAPLEDGFLHLNLGLPEELSVGDHVTVQVTVSDPTLLEPFVNVFRLDVIPKQNRPGGQKRNGKPKKGKGGGERSTQQGLSMPEVITVHTDDELWRRHQFHSETASKVISEPISDDEDAPIGHTFYINVDNDSLKNEMKYSKQDPRLLEAKFKYANVLLGLAMLHEEQENNGKQLEDGVGVSNGEGITVEDRIDQVTKAVAPIIIPLIDQLSGLNEEDLEEVSVFGADDL